MKIEKLFETPNEILSIIPTGSSMLPLIRGGKDRIFLKKFDCAKIRCGDIVVFKSEEKYIAHRVMEINKGNNVILLGDGNIGKYEECMFSDIYAEVVAIKRGRFEIKKGSLGWWLFNILWPKNYLLRKILLHLYHRIHK